MINAAPWTLWFSFGLSLTAILIIYAISLFAAIRDDFDFFPPPSKQSWQHKAFLTLFRLFVYPLVILTALVFDPDQYILGWWQFMGGAILSFMGFGMATRITLQMGWRNAFGEKRGLMTSGWFAKSRNPIYVFTWLGLIGWALIAHSILVSILLLAWGMMYAFAPHFEEPWLVQAYGEEYSLYKQKVRRFI